MDKFEKYKKEIENVVPREEIVNKTINIIKKMENKEKNKMTGMNIMNKVKKIIVGIITALSLTATCFAGYVVISGNTQILEKIGIKLSQNYDENAQIVNQTVKDRKVELELESVAVDNAFIVSKYNIKTNVPLEGDIQLGINDINFYDQDAEEKVFFEYENQQKVVKNEDGTYTVFVVSYINGVENANQAIEYAIDEGEIQEYYGSLISYIFGEVIEYGEKRYTRDNVELNIDVIALYDGNGEVVSGSTQNNEWCFKFILDRAKNAGKLITDSEIAETFEDKGLEVTINEIRENEFGTYVMVSVGEKYEEINDNIEYVDIVVEDQNGNVLKVISQYEEIFKVGDINAYGRSFDKHMILDADDNVVDYNIKLVTKQESQRSFEE